MLLTFVDDVYMSIVCILAAFARKPFLMRS